MDKWLTKGGLTAIFKDLAMAPVNLTKTAYNQDKSLLMAAGVNLPSLMVGVGIALSFNPVIGLAAFFGYSNLFSGILTGGDPKRGQKLFPEISAHMASPKL